jgi:hypothetical protein
MELGRLPLGGKLWITLITDREARHVPLSEYTHVALTVDAESLDEIRDGVRRHPTASPWQPNQTQGTVAKCGKVVEVGHHARAR